MYMLTCKNDRFQKSQRYLSEKVKQRYMQTDTD
jgi:hypothetical protein